jgi:hypothetical protein
MDDRYRRNVPDPSATIPDFGPRPDVKKVKNLPAESTRTPDGDVPAAGATPRATKKAPKPVNPLLIGVAGVLVAVVFGGLGFFVVVFAGMFIFFLTSMG